MQIVGFMEDEVQSVLELVAAVLKLGNIEFKPESRCNGTDESRVKDKNGGLGAAAPSSDIFYTVLFFLFTGVIVNIFSFHLTLLTPLLTGPGPESPSPVGSLLSSNNICVMICVTRVSPSQLLFLGKSFICIFPSVSLGQPCFPLFFPTFESKTALLIISCNVLFR